MSSGTQCRQIVVHCPISTQQFANRWSSMPLGHNTGPIGHSWRRHEDRMNDRAAFRELTGMRRLSENLALIARSVVLYGVPASEEQEIWQRVNHLTRRSYSIATLSFGTWIWAVSILALSQISVGFAKRITRPPHKRDSCMVLQTLMAEWGGEYRCTRCHRANHHLTEVCDAPEDWGLGDAFFQ